MILTQERMRRIGLEYLVSIHPPGLSTMTYSIRAVEHLILVLIVDDLARSRG